jgi:hypothetical protein
MGTLLAARPGLLADPNGSKADQALGRFHAAPGGLPALLAGTLAGLLVTWVTSTPCWVFLGAPPHVAALRGAKALNAALSAVTAAVVGVILNLAVWFGVHVVFRQALPWRGHGLALDVPVPGQPRSVRHCPRALPLQGGRHPNPPRLLGRGRPPPTRPRRRPVTSRGPASRAPAAGERVGHALFLEAVFRIHEPADLQPGICRRSARAIG